MRIATYLPERVLSNDELAQIFPEWTSKKIEKKLGVLERRISAENETALDMAVKACEKLFETEDRDKVDFILLCTQSPDYYLPTSACILLQRKGFTYSQQIMIDLLNMGAISQVLGY